MADARYFRLWFVVVFLVDVGGKSALTTKISKNGIRRYVTLSPPFCFVNHVLPFIWCFFFSKLIVSVQINGAIKLNCHYLFSRN